MKRLAVVLATLVATLALAETPRGDFVIVTRDGRQVLGHILSETQTGYLVAGDNGSEVVAFSNIAEMRAVSALPARGQARPQYAQAQYAPPPPPPPSEVDSMPMGPELQRQGPTPSSEDPRLVRHFGMTFGAMSYSLASTVTAQFNIDWTWGAVGLRVSPGFWVYASGGTYLAVNTDTKFLFNLGRHFSFGLGAEVGVALGYYTQLYLGPSFAPAMVKFGDRSQHQLSLQVTVPLIFTSSSGAFGLPMASLGYTYLF